MGVLVMVPDLTAWLVAMCVVFGGGSGLVMAVGAVRIVLDERRGRELVVGEELPEWERELLEAQLDRPRLRLVEPTLRSVKPTHFRKDPR